MLAIMPTSCAIRILLFCGVSSKCFPEAELLMIILCDACMQYVCWLGGGGGGGGEALISLLYIDGNLNVDMHEL